MTETTTTPAGPPGPSPEPLLGLLAGAQGLGVVRAALELGVFEALAAGLSDVESIAAEIKADGRGTRILLEALVAAGLVESTAGYRLSPLADAMLVPGRPGYFGGMLRIMGGFVEQMSGHLSEAVRHGGRIGGEDVEAPGHGLWEEFAAASAPMTAVLAQALAGILGPFAAGRDPLEVLDVACGSGLYSLTLAAAHPQAGVTLNDWPNVLDVTRPAVERLGLAERTAFLPGDVFEVPLGGPYDVITASNIFHMFSTDRVGALLTRLAGALRPGGRLAITGPIAVDGGEGDRFARLMSVLLLSMTDGGEAHDLAAYRDLLRATGLELVDVFDLPGFFSMRTLIATPAA